MSNEIGIFLQAKLIQLTLILNKGMNMTANAAFDNEKYIHEQKSEILERTKKFSNKLYLEFGGKLLFDYHASRVLPGYDPNVK